MEPVFRRNIRLWNIDQANCFYNGFGAERSWCNFSSWPRSYDPTSILIFWLPPPPKKCLNIMQSFRNFNSLVFLICSVVNKTHPSKCFLCNIKIFLPNENCSIWEFLEHPWNKSLPLCFFWLRWVFIAAHGLCLVAVSGGYSLLRCAGFSLQWL